MRVFVTGGTGFIGTEVVAKLISAGHSVLGLTRGSTPWVGKVSSGRFLK